MYQPILFHLAPIEALENAAIRYRIASALAAQGNQDEAQKALSLGAKHLEAYKRAYRWQLADYWRELRFDARFLANLEEPTRYKVEVKTAKAKRTFIFDAETRYQLERQVYQITKAKGLTDRGQARLLKSWAIQTKTIAA